MWRKIVNIIRKFKNIILFTIGIFVIVVWSYNRSSTEKLTVVCANDYPGASFVKTFDEAKGIEIEILQTIFKNISVAYDYKNINEIKSLVANNKYALGCGLITNENDEYFYSIPIIKNVKIYEISKGDWTENDIVVIPKTYEKYSSIYPNAKIFTTIDAAANYYLSERKPVKIIIDTISKKYFNLPGQIEQKESFDLCLICRDANTKERIDILIKSYNIKIDCDNI